MMTLGKHMGNILNKIETNDRINRCLDQEAHDELYDLVSELRLIEEELKHE